MRLSISHVPPEILSCIIANIGSSLELRNLALCSHGFYECVVPCLYEHVVFQNQYYDCNHSDRRLRKLATLLLQRPDLARHVRRWTFHSSRRNGVRGHQADEINDMDNVRLSQVLMTAIKASSHSEEEEMKWLKDARCTRRRDAILALVLPILVKLQRLDLQPMPRGLDLDYVERMMRRAGHGEKPFDVSPAFQALTKLMYTSTKRKCGIDPKYLALSMPFPSIHAIYGHCLGSPFGSAGVSASLAVLATASSTLKHLELRDCTLKKADITHLLRVPMALNTFILDLGSSHLSYCEVNPRDIRNALTPQEHCLEYLWLNYNEPRGGFPRWWDNESDALMGSFSSFRSLQVLKIAAIFLFGKENFHFRCGKSDAAGQDSNGSSARLTDLLPNSLLTLHLSRCEDGFSGTLQSLEDLILRKESSIPELKNLVLEGTNQSVEVCRKNIQRLGGIAESHGISLSVRRCNPLISSREWVNHEWGMDESIW